MNLDKITAKEMRKLSTKLSRELENVLSNIQRNAKAGLEELILHDKILQKATVKELKFRGFKVIIGGRCNEVDTLIKWKKYL